MMVGDISHNKEVSYVDIDVVELRQFIIIKLIFSSNYLASAQLSHA